MSQNKPYVARDGNTHQFLPDVSAKPKTGYRVQTWWNSLGRWSRGDVYPDLGAAAIESKRLKSAGYGKTRIVKE